MRILALDMATVLGWGTSDGNSGTKSFKLKSNESKGMKFLKFQGWLREMMKNFQPEIVVYEKPSGARYNSLRSGSNFEGVLLSLCEEFKVQYKDYSPNTIKSKAKISLKEADRKEIIESEKYVELVQKKGNYNKQNMIDAAEVFFTDVTILDDNHADALWLLHTAKIDLNV